jgi:hypothetical protein
MRGNPRGHCCFGLWDAPGPRECRGAANDRITITGAVGTAATLADYDLGGGAGDYLQLGAGSNFIETTADRVAAKAGAGGVFVYNTGSVSVDEVSVTTQR